MNTIHRSTIVIAATIGVLSGCASVAYDVAQDAAARACDKQAVIKDRGACRKQHETTYEQYEKQRQDIVQRGSEKASTRKDDTSLCFKRVSTGEVVCPN